MCPRDIAKQRKSQRAYSRKNKEKIAVYRKKRRSTIAGRATSLTCSCRDRSLKRGLPFSIDRDWVESNLSLGCAITGYSFNLDPVDTHMDIFTPSLDRIDPKKGYTKDNTQVICFGVNALKGVNTLDEMYKLASMINNPSLLRPTEHMMPD